MGARSGWRAITHDTRRVPPRAVTKDGQDTDTQVVVALDPKRAARPGWSIGARRGDGRRIA